MRTVIKASDIPKRQYTPEIENSCKTCGHIFSPGDWPFCSGKPEDHIRSVHRSGGSSTIVVHVNDSGEVSVPPDPNDPVDPGFRRVEINGIREYEKFRKQWEDKETAKMLNRAYAEKELFDQQTKKRREHIDNIIKQKGLKAPFLDEIRRKIDEKRDKRYYGTIFKTRVPVIAFAYEYNNAKRRGSE